VAGAATFPQRGQNTPSLASGDPAGDPFPPKEKRIPTPPGNAGDPIFVPGGDLIPTGQTLTVVDFPVGQAVPAALSSANRGQQAKPALPGSNERDPPARTGFSAPRALSPAYRKKRPPPSPSFYGRVNNLENFLCPASQGKRGGRFRDWVQAAGGESALPVNVCPFQLRQTFFVATAARDR
jgi:hypothetical protein